ncbi:PHD finger family protein [Salix suchowensis]|nr:PHD finger family protein [Salix suchowensis]
MVTICQKCGDRGFEVAWIYCDECQAHAVHHYCLDVLPETFDEYVVWLCYHCESKAVKLSSIDRPSSPIGTESDSESLKIIQLKKKNPVKRPEEKSKEMVFDCSLTNSDLLRPQISSDFQLVEVDCCEDDGKDQKLGVEADCMRTVLLKLLNIWKSCSIHVLPIRDPIWRGSMSIFQNNYGAPGGIVAHLSSIACSRASEEAKGLPGLLSPELLPRSGVWPKSFQKLGPAADHIGLYLFPDSERNEIVFDSLVNDMISQDLAMRVVIENAELLIYTSRILPMDCWRFQSKYYLWGVFRPKKPSVLASETWEIRSPVSPLSNGSYGSGLRCPSQDS